MMQIVNGDLLYAKVDALVNPVNTVGVMGKGIALQFKEAFPYNYNTYRDACANGSLHVGEILVVKDQNAILGEKIIINFPTKKHWRQPSQYEYLKLGLSALAGYLAKNHIKSIAVPPLGCGNGGLDWGIVKNMIKDSLSHIDTEVYLYEPNSAIKELLQQQQQTATSNKAKLTPARAMLLFLLFHYESLGEYSSLFSANKLAFFLQRMGENLNLKFEPHYYGPYAPGVNHVLYNLNGTYLNGLEQNEAKPFEPLKLNYDKFSEIKSFIDEQLTSSQKSRLKELIGFINGFESGLSLEVLSSIAMILDKNPGMSLEKVTEECKWNDRKKLLFKNDYIKIAYDHLQDTIYKNELFN